MTSKFDSINKLEGVLIVSCQADVGEPLCKPEIIAALSLSVLSGGASGLRLEGVENVRAVRAVTDVPIIGLTKIHCNGSLRRKISDTADSSTIG